MIYIIAFLLSTFIAYNFQKKRLDWWWFRLVLCPIVFLAAYRTIDLGRDTHYTYDWFITCIHSSTMRYPLMVAGKSELFVAILYYTSRITRDFNLCLVVVYVIAYGCVLCSLLRFRKYGYIAIGLIIYLLLFYRETYNTIRQAMAIYICMISFTYLIKSKYYVPIVLLPVAYGFHHSSYIFIIVILIKLFTEKFNWIARKKWMKFTFLIVGAFSIFSFQSIAVYLGGLGMIEEDYIKGYTDSSLFGTNLPISVLAMNTMNLCTFLYLRKNSKFLKQNKTFIEYILIAAFLCSFLGLISTFAVRIGSYFWGMTPLIMMLLFDRENRKTWFFLSYMVFICLYWFLTIVIANLGDTYPYKSVLFD